MKYINITHPDINNGLGCRVTLWIPGCSHNCPGCHNKWTHNYEQGYDFDDKTKEELFNLLSKSYIKGLTISGGDPLDQTKYILGELSQLLSEINNRFPTKDIWVYTGCTYEHLNEDQLNVLKHCDVLVDGPYMESLRDTSLPFRGSSNQRIINLKEQ